MQRPGLALALVGLLAAVPGRLDASDSYRLMPAQLVTRSEGLPSLRLAASGPIAFQVLTPEESGQPAAPNQLAVRLTASARRIFLPAASRPTRSRRAPSATTRS